MTPPWIANPFTGVIVQPAAGNPDQSAWFVMRVAPGLGKCRVTAQESAKCPFAAYVDTFVTVTGHFKDPAAKTCSSAPLSGETNPGPSKSKMVANCKREFVVTVIAAG